MLFITLCAVSLACSFSQAADREVARTLSCGGGISSNSQYRCVSVWSQASRVGFTFSSSMLNDSGFLHGDGTGAVQGADTDDDGLSDWVELAGVASDPNMPSGTTIHDTDGDSTSDYDESVAGTNAQDANSVLRIFSFIIDGNEEIVRWTSREGRTYNLLGMADVTGDIDTAPILATVAATGGEGPWRETVSTATNLLSGTQQILGIEVQH